MPLRQLRVAGGEPELLDRSLVSRHPLGEAAAALCDSEQPLLVPVHFMAISVWVEAMRHAPGLPREHRIPFCNGIGTTLLGLGVVFTAVGYYMQSLLPAMFGAAAMFITPISFLTSAARNARALLDKAALAAGIVIGPVLALNHVPFDLLWTGIVAGTLAYGLHRMQRARAATTDATP